MSSIAMDERLNQRERRFQGSRAGLEMIDAPGAALIVTAAPSGSAAFPQLSNPTVDHRIMTDGVPKFGQHAELEVPDRFDLQTINQVVYLYGTISQASSASMQNRSPSKRRALVKLPT